MAPPAAKRRRLSGQEPRSLSDNGVESHTSTEEDRDEKDSQSEESSDAEEQTKPRPSNSAGHARERKMVIGHVISKGLQKPGLFELQVDDLLADIRHDRDKKRDRIDALLRRLKEVIEHIPKKEELPV